MKYLWFYNLSNYCRKKANAYIKFAIMPWNYVRTNHLKIFQEMYIRFFFFIYAVKKMFVYTEFQSNVLALVIKGVDHFCTFCGIPEPFSRNACIITRFSFSIRFLLNYLSLMILPTEDKKVFCDALEAFPFFRVLRQENRVMLICSNLMM